MRRRLLRALARHAKLVSWLAVLGWLAWVGGAISAKQPFRVGWLGTLFFIFVSAALLAYGIVVRQEPLAWLSM